MPGNLPPLKLIRYLNITSLICVGIISLIFVLISSQTILYPYGVNYGEAPIINQANRILLGDVIYKNNLNSPPYIVTNYPPIFIYLISFLKSSFGIQLFLGGRLISFLSAVTAVCVIASISFRLTNKYMISLLAIGLFISHPYLISWSSIARVDLLALSLSLLGIFIILFYWKSNSGILLAVLLFSASIYTRQSYLLAGPLGASVWLLKNDRKKFYLFFLGLFLVTSSIFIYLNTSTENGFLLNVVIANINEFSVARLLSMYRNFFITWPIFTPIVIFFLISNLMKSIIQNNNFDNHNAMFYFIIPYFLGSFISSLTVGKVGSDINYFLELIVALIIAFSVIFNWIDKKQSKLILPSNLGILIQLLWVLIIILLINEQTIMRLTDDIGFYDNLFNEIEFATSDGVVLSDDYLDMVVISGQQIYYQPFEYGQLYKAGKWNPANMVKEIEEKNFSLIVIGGSEIIKDCCWPEPIREAIFNYYTMIRTDRLIYFLPID